MFNKLKAWREVIKIGNVRFVGKETNQHFRANIIKVLKEEGWFSFLEKQRSVEDFLSHFGYSDKAFVEEVLETLTSDNTIKKENNGSKTSYSIKQPVQVNDIRPRVFNDSIIELMFNYAKALPDRLHGKYIDFSGGFNLFNWDDALSLKMYKQIQLAAFAFTNVYKNPGSLLDVGAGNGWNTIGIWLSFLKRGLLNSNKVKITGIEPDEGLLKIAQKETAIIASKQSGMTKDEILQYEDMFPEFVKGNALAIPFDDNTFDYVYVSQVLHWTDPKIAIKEMIRVTKPRGIIFGTENFFPHASLYTNLHLKVIKGAYGFFWKNDMINWAKDAGAKKIKFATPVTVFKFTK